jgi:tetratricopeptide (TPR) repeat protein
MIDSIGSRHAYSRVERGWAWIGRGEVIRGAREVVTATGMLVRALDRGGAVQILLNTSAALRGMGEYREARRCATKALAIAGGGEGVALAHNELGMIGKFAGRFADAERHYRAAVPLYRKLYGARSREMARLLHNLGGLAHARGDFAGGEPLARRAVSIAKARLPANDPERLAHEVAHAALLDGLDRQAESAPIYRRAFAVYSRTLGPRHLETLATLHNLAAAEHSLGRRAVALRLHRRSAKLHAELLGPSHPDTALALFNLAVIELDASPREALAHARRALVAFRQRLGARHPHTRAAEALLAHARSKINGKPAGRSASRSRARHTRPG